MVLGTVTLLQTSGVGGAVDTPTSVGRIPHVGRIPLIAVYSGYICCRMPLGSKDTSLPISSVDKTPKRLEAFFAPLRTILLYVLRSVNFAACEIYIM